MADVYQEIKDHFRGSDPVSIAEGRGAQGLKAGKKMFAMFFKGQLLLKLPPERVNQLVAAGEGEPYDPGTGSAMKDRVLIPVERKDTWIPLTEEALEHAGGGF